ncbi:serine hydrolase domain-containing protein [Testudinibacter sp. P27/CKL/0425]
MGYGILGKLLEHTDPKGRPFAQIAQEELFAPLQMNSRFGDMQDNPHRVAVSHTPKMRTLGDAHVGNLDMIEQFLNGMAGADSILPAGNAFGNIDDLYRFAENLRLNRMGQGVRLISPAMANYATQNHCGEMNNVIFEAECEKLHLAPLKAHFGLHGGYVRGHGHLLNAAGFTASPTAFSGMGGGSTFYMVDPERGLTVAFLSAGFIEGLPHLIRTAKLNDLAIAACL